MSDAILTFTPFKNATIFTLDEMPGCFTDTEQLQECLAGFRMGKFDERTERVSGFVHPLAREEDEALFHAVDGVLFLTWKTMWHEVDEFTVTQKVNSRIEELEKKGSEITKELEEDIKETTRKELMPFMPAKAKVHRAMVLVAQRMMVVDEASDKAAEDFTQALRKAIGSLKTRHLRLAEKPFVAMAEWIKVEKDEETEELISHWPNWVSLVGNKLLHSECIGDSKVKAKLQSFNLDDVATQKVLEDMGITQMPVQLYDDRDEDEANHLMVMSATLVSMPDTEKSHKLDLRLKGIKFNGISSVCSSELGEVNAGLFLMAKAMEYVINRLSLGFGGVYRSEGSDIDRIELSVGEKSLIGWSIEIRGEASMDEFSRETDGEEQDELYDQAKAFVAETRRGSVSGVQRKFKIGYNRAARIIEQLEANGVVSAPGHDGSREVLVATAEVN